MIIMSKSDFFTALLFLGSLVVFPCQAFTQTSVVGLEQSEADRGREASNLLIEAEAEMNATFSLALQSYTPTAKEMQEIPKLPKSDRIGQIKWNKRIVRDLRRSQKAWLAYRDSSSRSIENWYDGGSGAGIAQSYCALEIIKARTKFLRDYFALPK
jgi:uncharacterized protein YecT (DUF1311 family)